MIKSYPEMAKAGGDTMPINCFRRYFRMRIGEDAPPNTMRSSCALTTKQWSIPPPFDAVIYMVFPKRGWWIWNINAQHKLCKCCKQQQNYTGNSLQIKSQALKRTWQKKISQAAGGEKHNTKRPPRMRRPAEPDYSCLFRVMQACGIHIYRRQIFQCSEVCHPTSHLRHINMSHVAHLQFFILRKFAIHHSCRLVNTLCESFLRETQFLLAQRICLWYS